MRLVLLLALVAVGPLHASGFGGSLRQSGMRGSSGMVSGAVPDTGTINLTGASLSLSMQCLTTGTPAIVTPAITPTFARASSAWCTKSDGSMVLMSSNVPRRERPGILIEPVSTGNLVVDPRDLSAASWTKSNMTCTKTATGPDDVANSASTCTATAGNGTATQALVVASALRSTSMRIKRRTGTGAVYVSRNNFSSETDISSSLSSSTWKWVRAICSPGRGTDVTFNGIDNCAAASLLTATAANPTIAIKLATSGDAIDIDMVQDEASNHATSPQTGFTRAVETFSAAGSVALLPVASGELNVDYTTLWTGDGQTGDRLVIDTNRWGTSSIPGVAMYIRQSNGAFTGYVTRTGSASVATTSTSSTAMVTGIGRNRRIVWGGGSIAIFDNGRRLASSTGANMPDTHNTLGIGHYVLGGDKQVSGWISRVEFNEGAYADFKGADKKVYLVGDSIVTGSATAGYNADGTFPPQVVASTLSYGLAVEKYVFDGGVSGDTITQCQTRWDVYVAETVAAGAQSRTVMMLQCGTNSLAGLGAAATFAIWEDMLDSAVAAGIAVVPATITPYSGSALEDDFNSLAAGWATTNSVELANTYAVMEDPGTPGAMLAAYHGGDALHPNTAGTAVMVAEWIRAGRAEGVPW